MEFHKNHKMSITKLNKFLMASWQLKSHFQSKSILLTNWRKNTCFWAKKSSIFGLNSIKLFEKTRSAQKCILTAAGAGEKRIGDGETNPCNCFVQSISCSFLKLQQLGETLKTFRDNVWGNIFWHLLAILPSPWVSRRYR